MTATRSWRGYLSLRSPEDDRHAVMEGVPDEQVPRG
jgi:hypothetical protein